MEAADLIALVGVVYLALRTGRSVLDANGSTPFLAFYLFIGGIVSAGAVRGLVVDEQGAYYALTRIAVVIAALVTYEWARAGDWRPWRWRW